MKTIVSAGIYPHPAIVIPAVGQEESVRVAATFAAMSKMAGRVKTSHADVIVLITPHGPLFRDAVSVMAEDPLTGSMQQFGVSSINMTFRNDKNLLAAIELEADRAGIRVAHIDKRSAAAYGVAPTLDHGAMVPLYFLQEAGVRLPLVHITFGLIGPKQLYAFGQATRRALSRLRRHAAVICSSDLSHRLTEDAPAGYAEAGREFDQKLVSLIEKYDVEAILNMNTRLLQEAGECGYRSIVIGLGILDGDAVCPEIISYEGPFGVGYLVADITPGIVRRPRQENHSSEHVKLAKEALESFVLKKKLPEPPARSPLTAMKAAAFVSLKINGELRGCIGTIEPAHESLAAEIIENAVSAGIYDPRFQPVSKEELPLLTYSVDVLSQPEEISGLEELDPKRYGVIAENGNRRGLLLPDLEGVDSAEMQVSIALQKAGIRPGEPYRLQRFLVERYY